MINEKSCGAVVFYRSQGTSLFLIEHMVQGHYALCKGHVENDENEYDTALREIKEETGLSVKFIDGFREKTEYSPYFGCIKEVIYFLAEANSLAVTPQAEEVKDIQWLDFDAACRTLTYESDKRILIEASYFLNEKYKDN